jgi:hypothetical protein
MAAVVDGRVDGRPPAATRCTIATATARARTTPKFDIGYFVLRI